MSKGKRTQPKTIDYQVTLRVSLGAAYAFADMMEMLISDPRTNESISAEWVPQVRKDIEAVRTQTAAQDPGAMASIWRKR